MTTGTTVFLKASESLYFLVFFIYLVLLYFYIVNEVFIKYYLIHYFTLCFVCLCIIRNDHFVWRNNSVDISFVYRTISRHAAHVALSFVSRYRSVAI